MIKAMDSVQQKYRKACKLQNLDIITYNYNYIYNCILNIILETH